MPFQVNYVNVIGKRKSNQGREIIVKCIALNLHVGKGSNAVKFAKKQCLKNLNVVLSKNMLNIMMIFQLYIITIQYFTKLTIIYLQHP